nr:YchJ family metal-binding protein [Nocardioides thalensis]
MHAGLRRAATAEELMRSRYSAFVVHDEAHVLRTWHPATRPEVVDFDPDLTWTGLEVVSKEAGGPEDTKGVVEFRASYVVRREPGAVHEVSRFLRTGGAWLYVRGRLVSE